MYFPKKKICHKVAPLDIGNVAKDHVCTKIEKKAGTMEPGVLWYFCGEHNKCVGLTTLISAKTVAKNHYH